MVHLPSLVAQRGEKYEITATVVETAQLEWWLRGFGSQVRIAKRQDVGGISNSGKLSVLIDADSAQASIASDLLAEVSRDGTANIECANNDWTIPKLRGWKDVSQGVVIQPAQSSDTGETVFGAAEAVALRHYSRFASMTSSR